MAESEELKSCLMKVKEESEKFGLKLSIQKANIMASSPIASWQINGETTEKVTDFILGGSKTTIDGDCSHVIKRRLLLGRKAMTNLSSVQFSSVQSFVGKVMSLLFNMPSRLVITYLPRSKRVLISWLQST